MAPPCQMTSASRARHELCNNNLFAEQRSPFGPRRIFVSRTEFASGRSGLNRQRDELYESIARESN
jgi:hypothetical protein